jgi:hypothetical protein
MPYVDNFNPSIIDNILEEGEHSPLVYRTPVAIVKHKNGGLISKAINIAKKYIN